MLLVISLAKSRPRASGVLPKITSRVTTPPQGSFSAAYHGICTPPFLQNLLDGVMRTVHN